MIQLSAEQVGQRALDLGLIDERQLQEVWASFGARVVSRDDVVQTLVRRGLLTNYQVDKLLRGDKEGFFYGDYKVLYLVGTGTFARVFRAVHRERGQVVALKVLRKRYSDSPAQYSQFVREGQIGCSLRHANIVSIYEAYSRGTTHFLVMEFVEGQNLREFMKVRKVLEPEEALLLMTDIANGLTHAFERGLTHRDLKMSNVLISSKGQAKLVDFGLAAVDESISEEKLLSLPNARTIDYAALERVTGVRKDDTRSDIYFLGCVYYHMLTGRAPLVETRDRAKRLSKSRFQEIPPALEVNRNIPNSLATVIAKAMVLDPGRRYQNPALVVRDLEVAARRLKEDPESEYAPVDAEHPPELAGDTPRKPAQQTVLIVEANTEKQERLRNELKKAGYRVLLTGDPERAAARLQQDEAMPDCVVIDSDLLGESAVEAFNRLAQEPRTQAVPALLLLGENQRAWREKATEAPHRRVVLMPISMKQLCEVLKQLTRPDR